MPRRTSPTSLIGLFCTLLLLVPSAMSQQDRRNVKTLDCASPFFQSLMTAPLQNVREDLAVTLHVLDQFEYIMGDFKQGGCLGRPEARYGPKTLLLAYLENRWISESLGEPMDPAATARDAALQEMRRQESISDPDKDESLEMRRELALQRSLALEVRDQDPAADKIGIHLRNTSSWTIQLHPDSRASGSGWGLGVWFEPLPEGTPVKFDCLDEGFTRALARGEEISLACRRVGAAPADSREPAPAAPAGKGQWTLHRGSKLGWLTEISGLDVSVDSPQARERADALVVRSSCRDRGSCALEKEIHNRGRNDLPSLIVLVIVGALVLGLFLPRFSLYVLGPLALLLAAALVIFGHKMFVPFHSDGSPAGLLVPAIAWFALILCSGTGVLLILTGRARINRRRAGKAEQVRGAEVGPGPD